eukprot:GHVS01079937.1.p1 GENE.GHVS01079937.1~~GHVS01079937.1.p1  ORF type:complete len:220 (+),score=11.92 GHVS01079937.1:55-714(+)
MQLNNDMAIFTETNINREIFYPSITKTHGEVVLQDGATMDMVEMLRHLPGWDVCIDDPKLAAQVKDRYPTNELWAKKFDTFVVKNKTLKIASADVYIVRCTLKAVDHLNCKSSTLNVWLKGSINISENIMMSYIPSLFQFSAYYEGEMTEAAVILLVKTIHLRMQEFKAQKRPLVFGKGWEKFVPFLPDGEFITLDLAENRVAGRLGGIPRWFRPDGNF